ncbi:ribonuclease P protein component 1 [Natronorarus salvus]|uniref:ribonuclease P protein component 1 n=1 Tax=Natronorarus salvus TaxID=3117733 RepID=UPI00390839E5
MALTPETLPRHELNGLPVRVVDAENADLIGISGIVVIESMKTVHVHSDSNGESRVRQVPKAGSVFEFTLPTDDAALSREGDETAGERDRAGGHARAGRRATRDSEASVTVDGDRLLSRPARRTETTGDSPWR